jgi:lipoprotein-releasing system ATP-binding protein
MSFLGLIDMDNFIRVTGLNKSYSIPGRELQVLKDISFDVNRGELVALMGPSGVGKSTLLHILGALDRPTSGQILYDGSNILEFDSDKLAMFRNRTVGFVFQFHHLLPEFSALENTVLPALIAGIKFGDARDKAEQLLSEVGLSERLSHKPGELSGGEQQRVAVARALMLDPKVLLADEPTGNLDTQTGDELFDLLMALNKRGITSVMVTHNESLAGRCGRILRMKDGMII